MIIIIISEIRRPLMVCKGLNLGLHQVRMDFAFTVEYNYCFVTTSLPVPLTKRLSIKYQINY